jgi:hypothetical protein
VRGPTSSRRIAEVFGGFFLMVGSMIVGALGTMTGMVIAATSVATRVSLAMLFGESHYCNAQICQPAQRSASEKPSGPICGIYRAQKYLKLRSPEYGGSPKASARPTR